MCNNKNRCTPVRVDSREGEAGEREGEWRGGGEQCCAPVRVDSREGEADDQGMAVHIAMSNKASAGREKREKGRVVMGRRAVLHACEGG
jgi:hypothetical protein